VPDPHATGSRVPNGWGDPSTEHHLQTSPRYGARFRSAEMVETLDAIRSVLTEYDTSNMSPQEALDEIEEMLNA
jgi:allophanate hydrolase subunit 1